MMIMSLHQSMTPQRLVSLRLPRGRNELDAHWPFLRPLYWAVNDMRSRIDTELARV
jgi:hypothetical protein